jgi:hypothetical protein
MLLVERIMKGDVTGYIRVGYFYYFQGAFSTFATSVFEAVSLRKSEISDIRDTDINIQDSY